MESYDQVQCLIFYVDEDNAYCRNCSSFPSSSNQNAPANAPASDSEVKAYILLPEVFKLKRPELFNLFRYHGLKFIDEESHSILADPKFQILEIRLNCSADASLNPLSIAHPRKCDKLVKRIFKNLPIETSVLQYEAEKTILPAVDDGNLKVIEPNLKCDVPCAFGRCFKGNLLHVAATTGPSGFVSSLLERGFDIDQGESSARGFTPLHLAIIGCAPLAIVRMLVARGANVDAQERVQGGTSLHLTENLELAELLLENGADVNCMDGEGETPLTIALKLGRMDLLKVFLKHGASVIILPGKLSALEVADRYSSKEAFQYLLHTSYTDPELLKGAVSRLYRLYLNRIYCGSLYVCELARHVTKMSVINLTPIVDDEECLDFLWLRRLEHEMEFREQCEIEVARLKSIILGNTDILLYDVLKKNENQMACLLRNDYVAELAGGEFLQEEFPRYSKILKSIFEKGSYRKIMLEEGMKLFNVLLQDPMDLPDEIIEKIVGFLSNRDIIILRVSINPARVTRSD